MIVILNEIGEKMFLKRLESVGFKSFAEPITVDFVPGITAVVGPNGSGKSNITDAIRWVLGEQSAKSLRGSKMEDIIFQGSDTRKPLNIAEVTLILDNQDRTLPIDYQEVSVTRRVSRSGESEFFLNKQSCRLKDIVDLFMDSGLGREAFSIIGQGKIEEILSSKAEERRTIFDEAAGVLKYKKRKQKAEYKLAETQENLNRVEDIIYEIDGQLEPLKEQSSRAKDYLTHKDQLKTAEITLLRTEIETLHSDWQEFLAKIDQLKEQEDDLSAGIQVEAAGVEKLQYEIDQLDQTIEEEQQNLLNLTESFEQLTGKRNVILERSKHTSENKTKLTAQINQLNEQIDDSKAKLKVEQESLAKIIEGRKKTTSELKQLEQHLSVDQDELEQRIESFKADYIECLNDQATRRHAIKTIEEQLTKLRSQKERDQSRGLTETDEYQNLTKQENDLTAEHERLAKEMQAIDQVIETNKAQQQELEAELMDMRTKLEQGNRQIDRLQSRKEMLEEMKEDFQGFFSGVKAVLQAREHGKLQQIHGAVLELIDIPEPYLVALETALQSQAQHIVVEDEEAGRKAIAFLKQQNKGRATFLPLSVIKAKQVSTHYLTKIRNHEGFIALANQLPKTDDRFQLVVDYLLGNTIVAKSLKDANQIAKLVDRRFRIVTLEGDLVNPGGSMTGGARKSTNQNLFTRDKELKSLTNKVIDFEDRANKFEQKIEKKAKRLNQIKQELINQEEKKQELQKAVHQNEAEIQSNQIRLQHVKKQIKMAEDEKTRMSTEYNRLKYEKTEHEQELIDLETEMNQIQNQIDALTKEKEAFDQNKEKLQDELQGLRVKLAEENKEQAYQKEKTDQEQDKLDGLMETKELAENELAHIREIEASMEQISDLDEKIQKNESEKETVTQSIQTRRQKRLNLTQSLAEREANHRSLQGKKQKLINERQSLEVKANRLDVDLENRLLRLQEEYEISYEKAHELYEKTADLVGLRKEVKLIKKTIEELGTVNIGAIDEYERISERYQFLTTQQIDLVEAKETLYAVIHEMDQEMKLRFEETFTQIQTEFTEVFKELFGGGHAELSLTDPEALLETGVEIKAQPPGKKAQQLALLSGGERALTAISLLFAILRVRPVPFCVLDEVEAALDEANVVRFTRYLKQFSEETQFIVITHRKGTMEGADVLYGVTMQESGVSRFVSVKLEETDELLETN